MSTKNQEEPSTFPKYLTLTSRWTFSLWPAKQQTDLSSRHRKPTYVYSPLPDLLSALLWFSARGSERFWGSKAPAVDETGMERFGLTALLSRPFRRRASRLCNELACNCKSEISFSFSFQTVTDLKLSKWNIIWILWLCFKELPPFANPLNLSPLYTFQLSQQHRCTMEKPLPSNTNTSKPLLISSASSVKLAMMYSLPRYSS